MVLKLLLLLGSENGELPLLLWVVRICVSGPGNRSVGGGKVVVVVEFGKLVFSTAGPCVVMVVGDVDHVVGVYGSERGEAVANDSEEGDEDAVDDMHDVNLATTNVDPADKEKDPSEAEECD